MLQYEFSKREKALIVVFVLILIGLLWYRLVYVGTADQISALNSQISAAQTETETAAAQVAQLNSMRTAIEEQKAKGVQKAELPEYDNSAQLMQRLNSILKDKQDYSLSFDDVDISQAVAVRGATMSFSCANMKEARSTLRKLEQDTFACSVDSVSMSSSAVPTANTSGSDGDDSAAASSATRVAVTLHADFYERKAS